MPGDGRPGRHANSVPSRRSSALDQPSSSERWRHPGRLRGLRGQRSSLCAARAGRQSPAHGWLGLVASMAWRMSWVAASGWDRNETWEAATSTIVALARSAMNRWSAGGIALSWVPSRYQHGSVFHAGGPDGAAANAAAAYGRWVAAITAA